MFLRKDGGLEERSFCHCKYFEKVRFFIKHVIAKIQKSVDNLLAI